MADSLCNDDAVGVRRSPVTFAVVGDVHGKLTELEAVIESLADDKLSGVLMVGDFASQTFDRTNRRLANPQKELTREIETALAIVERTEVPCAWVPGNHDLRNLPHPGNVDRRLGTVADLRVFGIGGAGPAHFGFPYEWAEDEIDALDVPACDILLSHTPPLGTQLDTILGGAHVGSRSVGDWARKQARVLVCGHIHEGAGVDRLGNCLCLNAGSLGPPFERLQVGLVTFDTDEIHIEHRNLESDHRQTLSAPRR